MANPPASRRDSPARSAPSSGVSVTSGAKRPFDIDLVLTRIRDAVRGFRQAALFELAEAGYASPFEILLACIISIRTRDETTVPTAKALFAVARTPEDVARLSPERIDALIAPCTFHEPKSRTIHDLARQVVAEHAGRLPCDFAALTRFHGVGPKCASLTLGIACPEAAASGQGPGIGVDIHVHRVTNRWGYVQAQTPEQTMRTLLAILPRRYWVEINALLVPFGKHVCTGVRPRCSTCPVLDMCRQVGVTEMR